MCSYNGVPKIEIGEKSKKSTTSKRVPRILLTCLSPLTQQEKLVLAAYTSDDTEGFRIDLSSPFPMVRTKKAELKIQIKLPVPISSIPFRLEYQCKKRCYKGHIISVRTSSIF